MTLRVLVAPDKFAGTLTAPEAAAAIAEGWQRQAPGDVVTQLPMADGGPGFVDTLHHALGGSLDVVVVPGPLGDDVPVTVLRRGETAYVEAAQACGRFLEDGPEPRRDPLRATTLGVGRAVAHAVAGGARHVVVGLGGSSTTDGGAGLLAGLGATADVPLDQGPQALAGVQVADLAAARAAVDGVRLTAATDVQTVLLGMFGAARTFGPQKGLDDDQVLRVDRWLDAWVEAVCGSTPAERRVADTPGAGAAGGLGFALAVLGAELVPGVDLVGEAVGLDAAAAAHDLVVTGEGSYDITSRSGKAVFGVAAAAAARARPCIVVAGRVDVGAREMRAMGVESAYAVADVVGQEASLARPREHLVDLAARVARTWSPAG